MATAPSATVQVPGQDNGFFSSLVDKVEQVITDAGSQAVTSTMQALQNAAYNVGTGTLSPQQIQDIANANADSVARAGGTVQDQQRVMQETFAAANQVGSHGPIDAVVTAAKNFQFPAVFDPSTWFVGSGGSTDGSNLDWATVAQVAAVAVGAIFLIKSLK